MRWRRRPVDWIRKKMLFNSHQGVNLPRMKPNLPVMPLCAALAALVFLIAFAVDAGSVGTGPGFKGPVGLQLYSLRAQFGKDVPGTLDIVKGFGIKFFYHVHGYEFQPYKDGTLLDLLISKTNPKYVNYQMDIFWIAFPGQDPVKLLEKYGSRWQLMHLKDMKKGTPIGALTGNTDVKNDVTLGDGQIDIPAILHAAEKVGVKYYFIEDESPSSETQIPQSLKFLEQVK